MNIFSHQAQRAVDDLSDPRSSTVWMEQWSEGHRASATSTITPRLSNQHAARSHLVIVLMRFATDYTIIRVLCASNNGFL